MKISYFLLPITIKSFNLSWKSLNKVNKLNSNKNSKLEDFIERYEENSDDEYYISPYMLEYLFNTSNKDNNNTLYNDRTNM